MKNLLITACNDPYFEACETLVASVHRTSRATIDAIYVYSLGFSPANIHTLRTCFNVAVLDFPPAVRETVGDWYLMPENHGYKCFAVHHAGQHAKNVLWLDAGAILLRDAKRVAALT